ncbi:PKD domain-containing protein [Lacibacter sediminis]|uniref:PKD/Chitinase domain-containing protein n=1 Tax=Lacibacter sediminis TaxID=2760713 RepID=A0A7G5XIX0_9BACT|nr:PKD domain-containing protein [Lacibacter sediminis]QNA45423.1 hypothetical protein H4075_04265 [Lacibacter sediminis]
MKHLFQTVMLIFLIANLAFYSCKKNRSCESCKTNKSPIAVAGPDQGMTLPKDSVLLDGSSSNDPDGKITVWQWKKINGPVSFIITNSMATKATAKNLTAGVYLFELTVTDDGDLQAKDTIQVMVDDPQMNQPPVANAGKDTTVTLPANTALLDGSGSADPDNNITSYQWTKISGPVSSTITNASGVITTASSLTSGIYLFELKVTDAVGLFARDTLKVRVDDPNVNQPPVANAGTDTTIAIPANSVMLNGSGSADPNKNITNYQWTKILGPASSTITNAWNAITKASSLTSGVYWFELKVTDAGGLFDSDTLVVTVLSPTFNGSGVYIAGWGMNASGKMIARIWRENVLQDLSDGQYHAGANCVFVSGTDIYVAGLEQNASGKSVAKLWKNGVPQNLSNGQYNAEAKSVFVSGTDVYVAGWEVNANGNSVAKIWKNGVEQNLSEGGTATSVFVSGTDVYVAGWYNGVALWKNGVAQVIGIYSDTDPSVFVSGNDVYVTMTMCSAVGGSCGATLWKNGQTQNIDGLASSVFVSGSDVYVAGQRYWSGSNDDATIWKNGVAQHIGHENDIANSVFVSGNHVYAVGNKNNNLYFNGTAPLWKNGIEYSIPGLTVANSVFVQ